jgi:hypothetical protein
MTTLNSKLAYIECDLQNDSYYTILYNDEDNKSTSKFQDFY